MSEEIGQFYLELPGDDVRGTAMSKNMVMLHEHRDLIVKIEFPQNSFFRLYSPVKKFYDPRKQMQASEYTFKSGEEIHLWLSKFHQTEIEIQRQEKEGWRSYSSINPLLFDAADYSSLVARPAPIIFKVGPYGSPIGEAIKSSRGTGNIPVDYQIQLIKCHKKHFHTALAANHEPNQSQPVKQTPGKNTSELLKKWEINKFPYMAHETEWSCHAEQAAEYSWIIEILPTTELYRDIPDRDTNTDITASDSRITYRQIADAIVTALGEFKDKHKLVVDLMGIKFRIVVQAMKDGCTKKFIVFTGNAGTRYFIDAVKYGVTNVRVATITASQQTFEQLIKQSSENITNTFRFKKIPGAIFFICLAFDTIEWICSGAEEAEHLFAKFSTTLLGASIGAILAPFIAAAVGAIFLMFGQSAIAITVFIGGAIVVVGFCIGYAFGELGIEESFYNLYKKLRNAWESDLESIGYDDYVND